MFPSEQMFADRRGPPGSERPGEHTLCTYEAQNLPSEILASRVPAMAAPPCPRLPGKPCSECMAGKGCVLTGSCELGPSPCSCWLLCAASSAVWSVPWSASAGLLPPRITDRAADTAHVHLPQVWRLGVQDQGGCRVGSCESLFRA